MTVTLGYKIEDRGRNEAVIGVGFYSLVEVVYIYLH